MTRYPNRRFALAALLATAGMTFMQADGLASVAGPAVVVTKKGVIGGDASSGFAQYGLVLHNTSTTKDALGVTVTVRATDARGRAFTSDSQRLALVPAGASFVVAGALVWGVNLGLDRIATTVRVARFAPKGRRLPPVKRVTLDHDFGTATVTFANPYRKSLPATAAVYGIFLDGSGRIVAASEGPTDASVRSGATVSVDLSPTVQTVEQLASIRRVRVSVEPCGDATLTAACPVGADYRTRPAPIPAQAKRGV